MLLTAIEAFNEFVSSTTLVFSDEISVFIPSPIRKNFEINNNV